MSCCHPCAPRRHGPLHNGPWSWAKATLASGCESTSRVTAVVHAVVPCRRGTSRRFVCAPVSLITWPGRKTSPRLVGNQLVLANKPHSSPQRSGTGWRIKAEASRSSKMQARGTLCWCWCWDLGASHQVDGRCHFVAVLCRVHPQDEVSSSISVGLPELGIVCEMACPINSPGLEALVTGNLIQSWLLGTTEFWGIQTFASRLRSPQESCITGRGPKPVFGPRRSRYAVHVHTSHVRCS